MKTNNLIWVCSLFMLTMCGQHSNDDKLFTSLDDSGIDFENRLNQEAGFDVFRYRNYYNGGGVGIGDLDNDGLSDVFMTSNQGKNRLYKNAGNFNFDDITESAGVGGNKPWSTGVALADVDGDGWLDIYVCNSGDVKGGNRGNDLFINNQDGTFTEMAEKYGLADQGFSTHAAFFDFDQDGDLDCYLLNNSFRPVASLPIENIRGIRDETGGDKFYLNDNGFFRDLSDSLGVFGSVIGFGLGITLLDINDDSYTDIYVSNDFFERDYLYINVGGKSFKESLESYFDQISLFSMGADAADINNDGFPELFVTDMLPPDRERLKQTTMFDSYDFFNLKKSKGFYNQFMKNTLQLNLGNGSFSEISRYSGVDATDWSWGALMFDMDNNGQKDIFVTNGIYKDVTDQDFISYLADESTIRETLQDPTVDFGKFIDLMPSSPLSNYAFTLDTLLKYKNVSEDWGLSTPSFSNGAAYGDLDNDGDLDLIVNNVNQPAFIYKNNSERLLNHFVKFKLTGKRGNTKGIGTQIKVYTGDQVITHQHYPTRGFQSSMDYIITMGLGQATSIDSAVIQWDAQSVTRLSQVKIDALTELSYEKSDNTRDLKNQSEPLFTEPKLIHQHRENNFVDFDRERLMYHQLSKEGPALAVADLNGDGLDDFYIGGALGSVGYIYLNDGSDQFIQQIPQVFYKSTASEDVDAQFIDFDLDGDLDLYVVSGGNEHEAGSSFYQDRLYINNGLRNGKIDFELSNSLPLNFSPGSCVRPCDFDMDGDMDLFIGGRSVPGRYGESPDSHLLENDGNGHYLEVSAKYISQLKKLGMVTDAIWFDYDQDEDQDLVIVGEWMPVVLFENKGNFFQRKSSFPGLENTNGLYHSVNAADLNKDGFLDLILGNLGDNTMFHPSTSDPVRLFVGDLDSNESLDQIYAFQKAGKFYPYHIRNELNFQLSFIKKKYPNFKDYADKSMDQIFTAEQLSNSIQLTIYDLSSKFAYNHEGKSFSMVDMPMEAQLSPLFEILLEDVNGGGEEIIALGNFSASRPEASVSDANHGLVISLNEQPVFLNNTGLNIKGDVRAARILNAHVGRKLLIAKNNDFAEIYSFK